MTVSRRYFLKSGGIAMASLAAAPMFLNRTVAFGNPDGKSAGGKKVLIAIFQRGAVDGLNVVVPHGEEDYYKLRPSIAVPRPKSGDKEAAIDLDGHFGIHPAIAAFKPIYDAGHLAFIHAVGSPDNTRSHFDAQDYMESATPGSKSTTDGWLNRYLVSREDPKATPFRAVAFSQNLPRTLKGKAPAVAMANISDFAIRGGQNSGNIQSAFEQLYGGGNDIVRATGRETFEAIDMLKKANPQQYQAANGASYPKGPLGNSLKQIAQLIKADIGLEVAFTDVGGWDTHANEGGATGQLANRLTDFSQSIAALYEDLGDKMQDVVVLTMSEFGRTAAENGARGTDHGHANYMVVLGGPVKGGKVYSKWPGMKREQLYEGRDLAVTTDFRSVFGEVAMRHLGSRNSGVIFPGFQLNTSNFLNFIS